MSRAVDRMGRVLVVAGALTLLFVAFQLWGTNVLQAREQRSLKSDVQEALAERPRTAAQTPGSSTTTTTMARPPLGDPIGILAIPKIGLEQAFVEGMGRDELKKGPGHYPHSPLPGHVGNAAIAGHRTTYGAPFFDLDQLVAGDEIIVTTPEGRFVYTVFEQRIVAPDDVSVVDDFGDNRLTLTTCNPKYSARERLIVFAQLEGDPIGGAPESTEVPAELATEDVGGEGEVARAAPPEGLDAGADSGLGAVGWAMVAWLVLAAGVGGLWWWSFRRRPGWHTRLAGVVPFLVVLFFFFAELERVLPANF